MSAERIARVATCAALYASASVFCLLFLGSLAWGPVQFRASEALCVLALFTPDAVPGLALGCAIANAVNIVLGGTGTLGLLDVVFGTLATALGAAWTWRFRSRRAVALLGPVIANALIVPAYLPLMLQGLGFYTVPFTSVALDGAWPLMYAFGLVATAVGEAVVLAVLGAPFARALARSPLPGLVAPVETLAENPAPVSESRP
ncbi:QueT transporter family protein [Olsenella sp. YH-ols2217]|uniref:QueT transporter family protein n=1 Tax=Kribbibacterium absianum TaxID=3044210 RepID=A0ABT6ZJ74_9ACTN|nr:MULTISPECIES: QueT transporter family protein [unclassified Olsenella]MDJ1122674.1 QueT transporter family protein [Olsenella sp. YH-ols2216]MDJ1129112.1 QueT transporter family protein [Olsenella sp. YH-ols2217]